MDPSIKFEKTFLWLNILAGVFSLVFVYLHFYVDKKKTIPKSKNVLGVEDIPGPKPTLSIKIIGNMPQLWPISNFLYVFLRWGETYPEIFKFSGLNVPFVVLVSPELIHQLFKSSDLGHGVKAPVIYDLAKPYLINGIGVSKGKFWQSQRKILMRTQATSNLKGYMDMLNKHSQEFVGELEELFADGKTHTINAQLNVVFLKWICEMITGSNINNSFSELHQYHQNFDTWKESVLKRGFYPWLLLDFVWKLHPYSKVSLKAANSMIDFAREKIRQHRESQAALETNDGKSGQISELEKASFRTMLSEMLNAGMTDDQIVDEINALIMGGFEAGSTVMHFFSLMMGLHPEIQQNCQKEIDTLFESTEYKENGQISYETATSDLKYLERCLQETLRLFPPGVMLFRQLETPLNLESKNKSYVLPAGCHIAVSPFVTQRNSIYFTNPETFNPNRFLPEEVAKRHSCSFFPFSGGQRSCFGQKFAMVQLKVIAAYILRNFEICTYTKMEDVTVLPYVTITPDKNFLFKFKKRDY